MKNIAFNFIPRPNLGSLIVKRKGKVIKGETEKLQTAAIKDFRSMKNAAKRRRRELRQAQAGYTLIELMLAIGIPLITITSLGLITWVVVHFIAKFW